MNSDKQKEQLILALDLARIGFYDWNIKDDSLTFSKHMLEDWGIESSESFSLLAALDRIHPEDRDRVNQLILNSVKDRQKYSAEYRVVRPDNNIVWLDVNGVVEYDENSEPVRFFGTSVNITERKNKEAILEENEKMVSTFLDTMPQMSFIADGKGDILHFNQRWYDYVRMEGTEGQGWRDRPIHHPDDLQRAIKTWGEAVQTGCPYEITYRLRRHDGVYRWHLGRAFPVKDKHGVIRRWYGTNTDIHDQRIAIERNETLYNLGVKLSEGLTSEEVAERIINEGMKIFNAFGGIVLIREKDQYRVVSKKNVDDSYFAMLKLDSPGLRMPARTALFSGQPIYICGQDNIRRDFPDLIPFMEKNDVKCVIALPLKSKGFAVASVAYYLKEEQPFPIELKRFMESMAAQCGVAIDRAFLIEKQEIQKTELLEAVVARDEFFSIASHELKTPLTSLRLNAQLLKKKASVAEGQLDERSISLFLDSNDRNVNKLVRLVDDMLDISRIRTGKISVTPEVFDVNELVVEIVERTRGVASVAINFKDAGKIDLVGDRLRIEQVYSNLISNALRYGERKPIEVKLEKIENEVLFRVKDNGIGIPKDLHKTIFERYERGHAKDIQGLGLGLYISSHIVEAHGGKIWVESTPGFGSEFYVSLPV